MVRWRQAQMMQHTRKLRSSNIETSPLGSAVFCLPFLVLVDHRIPRRVSSEGLAEGLGLDV